MPGSNDYSMAPELRSTTFTPRVTKTVNTGTYTPRPSYSYFANRPIESIQRSKPTEPAKINTEFYLKPAEDLDVNRKIYRTQDWEDKVKLDKFGTAELNNRQERRFNRYARSKKGEADRLAFDAAEMDRFNQSVDAVVRDAITRMRSAYPKPNPNHTSNPTTPLPEVSAYEQKAALDARDKAYASTLTPKSSAEWNRIAKENGFADMGEVLAWQEANGLVADGKFGKASSAFFKANGLGKYQKTPEGYVELSRPNGTTFLQRQHTRTSTDTPEATPFDLMGYAKANGLNNFYNYGGKKFVRHDPFGFGDYLIGEDGKIYKAGLWGKLGDEANESNIGVEGSDAYDNYHKVLGKLNEFKGIQSNKQGGTMNKINYFQQGGTTPKQDIKAQVTALVQAAMQGDQKATQQVNQIMEAAKAGDQQALQIAQIMEQVIKELQGQATSAKWGTKLGYIKSLKYAKGGKTCPTCEKGKQIEMKACGGKKAKKRYFGGLI